MKMYEGVLQRVYEIEEKKGINYARTSGKLYSALKVLYSISGIWTFFMNLFFILGFWITYQGTDNMSKALNSIITVSVCTLSIIGGYIFNRVKFYIPSIILNLVPSCILIPLFANFLQDDLGFLGFKASFYWRHLIPIVLIVLFSLWLNIIALREKHKIQTQYKKVTENLFNAYNVGDEQNVTEEQWEDFLQNYDPREKIYIKKQEANEG